MKQKYVQPAYDFYKGFEIEAKTSCGYYGNERITMSSKNLEDAKLECIHNRDCAMFYDYCGEGNKFLYCHSSADAQRSYCGAVLYKKGKI